MTIGADTSDDIRASIVPYDLARCCPTVFERKAPTHTGMNWCTLLTMLKDAWTDKVIVIKLCEAYFGFAWLSHSCKTLMNKALHRRPLTLQTKTPSPWP